MTLEDFADRYDLMLEMKERGPDLRTRFKLPRWHCSFPNLETLEPGVLVHSFGNGETQEEAIADYCSKLSGSETKIDAYRPGCRKIEIPQLIP